MGNGKPNDVIAAIVVVIAAVVVAAAPQWQLLQNKKDPLRRPCCIDLVSIFRLLLQSR